MAKSHLTIAITGTPAVGKSSFARQLADVLADSKIIEINDVVDEYTLFSKIDKMGSKVVKIKELEKKMNEIIAQDSKKFNLIIVGHLIPELKLDQDITVVLRLNLKELIKRLEARNYEKEKIKENIVSESVDYCGIKAKEKCKETYEIETNAEKKEITEYILARALGNPAKAPEMKEISRFDELLELVTTENKYGL